MPPAVTIGSSPVSPDLLPEVSDNTRLCASFQQAKYVLKTKFGLSDEKFSHCQLHPIYGTGQGSANSPVIWVLISSRLFDAHAARAYGATFFSPDRSLQLQIFMIGFVDDSNACVNDFVISNLSPEILLQVVPLRSQNVFTNLHTMGSPQQVLRY